MRRVAVWLLFMYKYTPSTDQFLLCGTTHGSWLETFLYANCCILYILFAGFSFLFIQWIRLEARYITILLKVKTNFKLKQWFHISKINYWTKAVRLFMIDTPEVEGGELYTLLINSKKPLLLLSFQLWRRFIYVCTNTLCEDIFRFDIFDNILHFLHKTRVNTKYWLTEYVDNYCLFY